MRVLHIINRPQMRGAEMFAVRIAARLERRGVENALCSLYSSSPERRGDRFDTDGLRTYELDAKAGVMDRIMRLEPMVLLRLRGVLRDFKPDIIVGHGSDTLKYTALGGLIHRRARTVYKNIGTASYWANTWARVQFNKLWLRRIDCAVSVSEFTRQDFIRHYGFPASRSVFIPNAIQVEDFDVATSPAVREQARNEIDLNDNDMAIVMVGSLSRGKGQDDLIRAIAELAAKGLSVKLALVGDGPDRGRLERLAEAKGVSDRVVFMGLRRDVAHVLAGADIFSLASVSEGMPGVLIEAGLSGLPSIAYDVGGVREVLDDGSTGLVVRAGDFDGLTSALGELCVDSERRAGLGDSARAWCRARFDIASVSQQYEELFDQLLADRARFQVSAPVAQTDDAIQ